jgi:thiosulfate reductase cytochrome b subunit
MSRTYRTVTRILDWCLLWVTIIALVSGLGITHYRIVQPLTLGVVDKAVAFRIHFLVWYLVVILVVVHLVLRCVRWPRGSARRRTFAD